MPAEFSATFEGIDRPLTTPCPPGACEPYRLTLASDGSFRWTRDGGGSDMAYDAGSGVGRQVETVSRGATASPQHPNAFVTTGVPAGGPDMRITKPEPLGPISDFVAALARAGDPRVTVGTVADRPVWHYDGPTVQDRLGGDRAPNHAVADVDRESGVLLQLTRSVGPVNSTGTNIVSHFISHDVTVSDQIDRSRYHLDPPAGSKTNTFSIGFAATTLDGAAAEVPYDLLVPQRVPAGFTLQSVSVDRDVASSTGSDTASPGSHTIHRRCLNSLYSPQRSTSRKSTSADAMAS